METYKTIHGTKINKSQERYQILLSMLGTYHIGLVNKSDQRKQYPKYHWDQVLKQLRYIVMVDQYIMMIFKASYFLSLVM